MRTTLKNRYKKHQFKTKQNSYEVLAELKWDNDYNYKRYSSKAYTKRNDRVLNLIVTS